MKIKDIDRLDATGLAAAYDDELAKVGRDLGVPDQAAYRERVLSFPDVREIMAVWESVSPELRALLVAELAGAARDIANSYKSECQRCGRCCHCQVYIEAADTERGAIGPEHVEVLTEGRFEGGETVYDWRSVWEAGAVVRLKHKASGSCVFHDDEAHLCTIYEGRANHCRQFFCRDDLVRRQNFSFPDLVQHLGGQGADPLSILMIFVNLRLWRKADELRALEVERRREFAQMMGLSDEAAVSQFLGPPAEERIREAAASPKASEAVRTYCAHLDSPQG